MSKGNFFSCGPSSSYAGKGKAVRTLTYEALKRDGKIQMLHYIILFIGHIQLIHDAV